jgi:putative radical SAM enzyme (TIGR03279 family)
MNNRSGQPETSRRQPGALVRDVVRDSPAYRGGLRRGDRIVAINGEPVRDDLDVGFLGAAPELAVAALRRGAPVSATIRREYGELIGLEIAPPPLRQCVNRCLFCFIDQLPGGLRKNLSVKDEDYRHSFLNGSYITLTSLDTNDMRRIVDMGLSPLYISVHATDPAVRVRLLRNRRAGDILDRLRFLEANGVCFHAQIVVCPGINDGATLERTVDELLAFESLLSLAIVPVGLTRFHREGLSPVEPAQARTICGWAGAISDRDAAGTGVRRLFCADELFIRAGLPIPPRSYYEEYPQIENGVGLVRQLFDDWAKTARRLRASRAATQGRALLLTSVSAEPYVRKLAGMVQKRLAGWRLTVRAVENRFFGQSVTVAGLLTARDVIRAARAARGGFERVIAPAAMFNYRGYTLDGYSIARLSRAIGAPLCTAGDPKRLCECLMR